ncbi:hypothetical protein [Streptomyces sp. NRRL WC-3742]|uniref:hypothetical protein n=1 Tax=Streptomyces sp. NRRL WC-3742 TaxID=1463934 RepID=UPI0004C74AFB|nr:hypothetical protein [Streptomyces sp. NRRL WC-3742]
MTVLHSRNADAADPADVAAADAAADVKDSQDAAEPDLREDLGRYAELGAFTLSADTHAWYAAVDTVATPEDARAASTVLAELRGRDLQQLWETVTALVAEVKIDEPATVATTAALVETLQRVRTTSATLTPAAYDTDLGPLVAATADSAWRKERDVKLSWLRGRSLRKQAAALAHDRRIRREDLHEALASALVERRAWALLAPAGTLPAVPADGALVDTTAQAFEALGAGIAELARLLPGHDLDGIAFADLIELVERLAADEGTLYRLPTIRGLRATLEEAGLGDLLAELTAARADRRAAEAAYAARQALAGGQRDGLAEAEPVVEAEVEAEVEAAADAEAAARQALAGGQRDGQAEAETVVEAEAEADVAAADVDVEAEADAELTEKTPAEPEAEAVDTVEAEREPEATATEETDAVDDEPLAEIETETEIEIEETPAASVSLPAPSPAADDLVAAAVTAATAETVVVDEEPAAPVEIEPEAEVETEPEAVEVEAVAEVVTEEPEAPAAVETELEAAGTEVEPEAVEEPTAQPEAAVEVEEPTAAPEPVVEAEPVAEEVEAPVEEAAEVEAEAVEEAPATEATPAEDAGARSAKPDFTPGRPVTAYSAEELLAIVRWIDGDGVERTDEELLRAGMKELGFARLGPRIKEALGAAVTAARG